MPKNKYDPINDEFDFFNDIIGDEFDFFSANFKRCKEFNRLRFQNYCHKGTILTHATSKIQWEVQKVYEHCSPPGVQFEDKATFIKMKSKNGGSKTGKKYIKNVNLEHFYMYDITEVSNTVKVLWGDPKNNPPRKPEDFK